MMIIRNGLNILSRCCHSVNESVFPHRSIKHLIFQLIWQGRVIHSMHRE
jgi:hypothetical protein